MRPQESKNPVALRAAYASVGGEKMEWSEGEITVFDDSFETVYANEVVSYYFDSKYHDWWDATQCAELCKNIPDRFWEQLVDKLRHPAILGWAA